MAEMTREEAISKVAALIAEVPVAMLTTTSPRGWLRSRPMVAQRAPFDGDLWFLTSRTAAKAGDVRDRRQVNVSFASPDRDCYVSIGGIATLVDDRERTRALWTPSFEPWFPKGVQDPDLVAIRVQAEEVEYWDPSTKRMVHISPLYQPKPVFRDVEPAAGY